MKCGRVLEQSDDVKNDPLCYTLGWLPNVRKGSILLKKSEYRLGQIFLTLWVRFSVSDAGGLIINLRLNGASSKSICGGNKRESKMSLVFWQICNDYRLATFSTESVIHVGLSVLQRLLLWHPPKPDIRSTAASS
jgi:hypothetical protein